MVSERKILILQNYPTPYRDALFEALRSLGIDVTVLYLHAAEREGRRWSTSTERNFTRRQARYFAIRKMVFFSLPGDLIRSHDRIILLDDNPTGLCMMLWSVILRMRGRKLAIWCEHIPHDYKSSAKRAYQRFCSRMLMRNADCALPFSRLSEAYVDDLAIPRPVIRMVQATPRPDHAPAARSGRVTRFGYLGSDLPRKNVPALIAAFQSVRNPQIELHIAGVDAMPGLNDERIRLHGYLASDALERFFAEIDVLILPSLTDPWGLVVNEALSRGCLAMVSDRCGSAELVEQISPALVCGIDAASIAAGIINLAGLSDDEVRALRDKALVVMQGYTIEAAAKRLAVVDLG